LHPEQAPVVREIVDEVIAGAAVEKVAFARDTLPSTLWKMLTAKYLLGHATYERQTVRDSEGRPVLNADPILTQDKWDQLQSALEARRRGPLRTRDTAPLNGVVKCFVCDENLFHKIYRRDYGKGLYRYYHCRVKDHCAQVEAEIVEELVESAFLDAAGALNVQQRVYFQAENHQMQLDEAVRAVDELTPLLGTVTSDTMRKRLTAQLSALDSQITALEKLESKPARYEYIETDVTYKEAWENADVDERRDLLIQSGIRFFIQRIPGTAALNQRMFTPDNIQTLLNTKKPLP